MRKVKIHLLYALIFSLLSVACNSSSDGGAAVNYLVANDNNSNNLPSNDNTNIKPYFVKTNAVNKFVYSITSDGKLYTWGNNEFGNTGNGTTNNQTTPHLVEINGKIKNVVSYLGNTVFAITEEGKLYSWGKNISGQVGNGTTNNQTTPYLVEINGKIKDVDSSCDETIYAITEEGKLYSWGNNISGQVGNGTTNNQTTPYLVEIDGKIKNVVSSCDDTVFAITEDGKLYSWGKNNHGQIGDGKANDDNSSNQLTPHLVVGIDGKVKDIIIDNYTVYAITEEDKLYSWGNNQRGQVGSSNPDNQNEPMIKSPEELSIVGKVKNIFISFNDTVYAVTEEGKLYSWGNNTKGQVGNGKSGDNVKQIESHLVEGIDGKVKDIVLSPHTVFVITEEGKLYSWGQNNKGQVGNGTDTGIQTTPYNINILSKKVISVGYNASDSVFAITEDGYLYGWGNNPYPYNLLAYSNSNDSSSSPRRVNTNEKFKKIFTNAKNTTYALTEDNRLYSWGYNDYGELGNGESKTKIVKEPYELTTVGKVKDVLIQPSSYDTTKERATVFTITEDNRLYAWGFNDKGQVGNGKSGDNEKQTTPYEIK